MMPATPTAATEPPLSILQLCNPTAFGGLERVVQGLSLGLAARGHRVTVAGVHVPGADRRAFFEPLAAGGVATRPVVIGARDYLGERREVARLLDELRVDVVQAHGYRADIVHRGSAAARQIGFISTMHGTGDLTGLTAVYDWLQERLLHRSDAVIAVSTPIAARLQRRVSADRLHVVPNAWVPLRPPLPRAEARARIGLPADVPVIGWVGRLAPVKGPDLLLQALAGLSDRPWLACIVGEGPERLALEALAATLGLQERVRFVGALPEAGHLSAAYDVFALSSRSEGTPIALLEAMAARTAVVAFGVGGVPSVLNDTTEGWLCPPGDLAAMTAAFEHALHAPAERARRAAAAADRLEREFGVEPWLDRHERIYRAAIQSARSR